jgi:hypothetical protein
MRRPRVRARARRRPTEALLDRRERLAQSAPLLLGLLVAVNPAAAAITVTTNEPNYEFLLHLFVSAGIVCSFLGLALRVNPSVLGTTVMVLAFLSFAFRHRPGLPLPTWMFPPEVATDDEIGLAALVAWFMVGFAFMQHSRENLIFVFATGLATIGLMATRNLNPELLVCFCVFLLASIFAWGYSHFLQSVARLGGRRMDWSEWAQAHLSGAVLLFVLAGVGGALIGNGLYYATPRIFAGAGFQQRVVNWTGAQVGGYFMFTNSFGVGSGPIRLSPEPVLKVRAEQPTLLRGRVYDVYDDHGWSRADSRSMIAHFEGDRTYDLRTLKRRATPEDVYLEAPGRQPLPPQQPVARSATAPRPKSRPQIQQEIELVASPTASLFGAPTPVRLKFGPKIGLLEVARPSGVTVDSYGGMLSGTVLPPGQRYTVWSEVPETRPEVLRQVKEGDYDLTFREQYITQTGLEAARRLRPLVAQITKGLRTPYDRAAAIARYLETNCTYTLEAPGTPEGQDAVSNFVLVSRRGACDLFASAMTIMCRLDGLPARVATGFNHGEYDASEQAYIVRGLDAHAWSEVYFPGYGWVPFDLVADQAEGDTTLADLFRSGNWRGLLVAVAKLGLWSLLAVVGLYMVAAALIDPRRMLQSALRRWALRQNPALLLGSDYERLARALARRARLRFRRSWTPRDFLQAVTDTGWLVGREDLARRLELATGEFYDLRYGPTPPTDQICALRRKLLSLRRQLRKAKARTR